MFRAGELVIVSVSGGPDSVALLHLLVALAPELGIALHVFHLDHGLRGDESAEDARFVRRLADSLSLSSTIVGLGPEVLARRGGSLQAAARTARHEELSALATRLGAHKVALGHNRDDQAETVLMRFLRGTGTRGLAGIHPVRQLGELTFVRPLLAATRKEIEAYCATRELFSRLDASNLKTDYWRNQIRLELMPFLMRHYNPALTEHLATLADLALDEDRYLDSVAQQLIEIEGGQLQGPVRIDVQLLGLQPLAIARRVLRILARCAAGPDYELGFDAVARVLELAGRQQCTGSHLDLPGGLKVIREYGKIQFMVEEAVPPVLKESVWELVVPGTLTIPELALQMDAQFESPTSTSHERRGQDKICLDVDRLPGPLRIRFRSPGDRLWPTGMSGSKKLQDIMVDAKIPQRLRDRLPLLVAGDELLWVIGVRRDRRYLATETSTNCLVLRVTDLRETP